jgi:putative flippase GtrA
MIPARQAMLFGLVGVVGFFVDAGVLYLLKGWLGLYVGRAVSFFCAVAATWLLNRAFTFGNRASGHGPLKEMLIYLGLMMIGGAVNYLAYALLVAHSPLVAAFPVLGVAAGSLAGMTFNLLTSRFLLFRHAAPASG